MHPVLAFDIGASAVKAGVIDGAGAALALASVPCRIALANDGVSEIDPERWWRALRAAAASALRQACIAPERIGGIAGTGMTRTQIAVGRDGRALRPAITWLDRRAEAEARMLARYSTADAEPWTAYHPLARLLWLARQRWRVPPAAVLEPKDFIVARLTERFGRDTVSAYRIDRALARLRRTPIGRLLRHHSLPDALPPHTIVGKVAAGLPPPFDRLAGKPVALGSQDTWSAALGMGAVEAGQAFLVSGTSEALGYLSPKRRSAPGLLSFPWLDGLHQTGGPSQHGMAALDWWRGIAAQGATARAAPSTIPPPLFLPFLAGARLPYWNPALRGALMGLDFGHNATDIANAIAAGVALLNRDIFDRATGGRLGEIREIRIGGGAARDDAWCQIKADAIGRPVLRMAAVEPGLVGVAMALRRGLNSRRLYALQAARLPRDRRFSPNSTAAANYGRLLPAFRRACAAALELSAAGDRGRGSTKTRK